MIGFDWTVSVGNLIAGAAVIVTVVVSYIKARDREAERHAENVGRLTALETQVKILYDAWRRGGFKP